MKVKYYTDDGDREIDINSMVGEIDTIDLVELMYDRLLLSAADVNKILPCGYEVVE